MQHPASNCKSYDSTSNANVVPLKNSRQHFDPAGPVPARIAELREAVLDGKISAQYVKIAVSILQRLEPDQRGNWHTVKPLTHALIAELFGCHERTVRTVLCDLRQRFPWFNWRKVEDGTVFRMGPDGCMSGKLVARSGCETSLPKEIPRRGTTNRRTLIPTVPTLREVAPVAFVEPAPVRLSRWLALLSAEVITYGVSLGLTRREVLYAAERFANYYGANPEREPKDLTAAFCGYRWLQRDARRKAAAIRRHPERYEDDLADDYSKYDQGDGAAP
jgi:hypothetical protein